MSDETKPRPAWIRSALLVVLLPLPLLVAFYLVRKFRKKPSSSAAPPPDGSSS